MDRIHVRGGARLTGESTIRGAKNAAVALVAACMLTDATLCFTNVPAVRDIFVMFDLLRHLGVEVDWTPSPGVGKGGVLKLTAKQITDTTAPYEIVSKMRASFL